MKSSSLVLVLALMVVGTACGAETSREAPLIEPTTTVTGSSDPATSVAVAATCAWA